MKNKGYILIQALVFAGIGVLLVSALASWAGVNLRSARTVFAREQAFQVAEAGIEYYRWHLAHAKTDYQDGHASSSASYLHDYHDKDGNLVGHFELTITPPPVGSTVVVVKSKGTVVSDPSVARTLEATLAIPSLAKYSVVANDEMRFGEGTEVFGPIHSNEGLRFDGLAHNLVTSAKDKYDDPDHGGANEFGVHTHRHLNSSGTQEAGRNDEEPPQTVVARSDVFMSGRQFPVPAVDFNGFTADLAEMKTDADDAGDYWPDSGEDGYLIVLKTNDTYDLYSVDSLRSSCGGSASWSVNNKTLLGNHPLPANGLIFVEDDVWVEGKIDTARVTVASGRFPEDSTPDTSITVNNDLLYTNYDGRDVISLIAQKNINAGLYSEDDLEIDAALVAKNGRVGRYDYNSSCSGYRNRHKIKLYGMLATNIRYGFAYVNNGNIQSGYDIREIIYDGNLLYGPPPSFPLTSDQYQTISWREL